MFAVRVNKSTPLAAYTTYLHKRGIFLVPWNTFICVPRFFHALRALSNEYKSAQLISRRVIAESPFKSETQREINGWRTDFRSLQIYSGIVEFGARETRDTLSIEQILATRTSHSTKFTLLQSSTEGELSYSSKFAPLANSHVAHFNVYSSQERV